MDRAALVIGGSRGLGLALAVALSEDGYGLTIGSRDEGTLADATIVVGRSGNLVTSVVLDVSVPDSIDAALAAHRDAHGRLDVLVVAAGRGYAASFADTPREQVARLLEVNVIGLADAVRAALPDLRSAADDEHPSHVLLLGSIAGRNPVPGHAAYSASKAAVRSLAASISREEAGNGVRATVIAPGYVATDLTARMVDPPPAEMLPVGDVVEAARFVLRLSARASVEEILIGRAGTGTLDP